MAVLCVVFMAGAAAQDAKLRSAESLLRAGQIDQAQQLATQELAQHPSSIDALNLLGIIDSTRNDYNGALTAFRKALAIAPRSVRTHNNLGNLWVAMNKPEQAEEEFRTVLRLDPADRDGNYNLGVLLLARGAAAEAIPHFERVRPASAAVRLNLVRADFEAKREAAALQGADSLSADNPKSVQVHFSLGLLLAAEKQYQAAERELEKADALQPQTFEILYNLGQAYLRGGDAGKADVALTQALRLKPDSVDTMYLLAAADRQQSRPLDALDLLIRAHKLAPNNTDVIYLMAQVSMSQNYYEDAIPLLESGVAIAPKRVDLRAALGESYFMAGKVDKAIEQFTTLLQLERSARSYAFLGLCYRNLGRYDEAKKYFEQGLQLDPRSTSCLFNLGYIAERQGDAAAAEAKFQEALRINPGFSEALLELANLRIAARKLPEAEQLLRKYVKLSQDPGPGYYRLAMVERSLHETAAAERDLNVFRTMSKNEPDGPYPYQHLFDYLNNRAKLAPGAREQLDLNDVRAEVQRHPDQPQDLYLLAEASLKAGKIEDGREAIAQLDKLSAGDYRTLAATGVLLAKYHLYEDAITHFQQALAANPDSDDVKFDLANAYFHRGQYAQALDAAQQVSEDGRHDEAYLSLLGDIYAHLGEAGPAERIYEDAIARNPDKDQGYLSLALLDLREGNTAEARRTLQKGLARIPASGKLYWGLGLASALEGKQDEAARQLERAVDLMPEWSGGYSTLGVLYFETGQTARAREVLGRFRRSSASGSLDADRIEQVLDRAAAVPESDHPLTPEERTQFLQLALSVADRTL